MLGVGLTHGNLLLDAVPLSDAAPAAYISIPNCVQIPNAPVVVDLYMLVIWHGGRMSGRDRTLAECNKRKNGKEDCENCFCSEFARLLRQGGRVGISDLTRSADLPKELESLLAWISCLADAQPLQNYVDWFRQAGLVPGTTESHDEALREMVRQVRAKLLAAEVLVGLKKIDLAGIDFTSAKQMASSALDVVEQGRLGYALITAEKPE